MINILKKITKQLVHYYLNIASFEFWQKNGYHVLRNYYYSPIPDTSTFENDFYTKESELVGINLNEEKQLKLLDRFVALYRSEYDQFPDKPTNYYDYYKSQSSYNHLEAQILYCFVRDLKPKKIIEIGSGFSTMLTAQALRKNKSEAKEDECNFIAIEPYPNDAIKKGFEGLTKVLPMKVEDVSFSEFETLQENDILFIDSSHTVRAGGDVVHEVLEILPRIKKGVYIHIHDIFFPFQYPKQFFDQKRFWAEQYLVQAFLINNDSFEICWASHFMHRKHSNLIKESMDFYQPTNPFVSSLWIKKVK